MTLLDDSVDALRYAVNRWLARKRSERPLSRCSASAGDAALSWATSQRNASTSSFRTPYSDPSTTGTMTVEFSNATIRFDYRIPNPQNPLPDPTPDDIAKTIIAGVPVVTPNRTGWFYTDRRKHRYRGTNIMPAVTVHTDESENRLLAVDIDVDVADVEQAIDDGLTVSVGETSGATVKLRSADSTTASFSWDALSPVNYHDDIVMAGENAAFDLPSGYNITIGISLSKWEIQALDSTGRTSFTNRDDVDVAIRNRHGENYEQRHVPVQRRDVSDTNTELPEFDDLFGDDDDVIGFAPDPEPAIFEGYDDEDVSQYDGDVTGRYPMTPESDGSLVEWKGPDDSRTANLKSVVNWDAVARKQEVAEQIRRTRRFATTAEIRDFFI